MEDECDAERAVADATRERLQLLLQSAASAVLPPPLPGIWLLPKEAVKPSQTSSTSADLQCHAPATAWKRLRVGRAAEEPVFVTTVSEYGLTKEATYHTAQELGQGIITALGEEAREVASDLRVRDDGCLLITSQLHMRR